jgi:MerR family copper efflux transcriptional regulator
MMELTIGKAASEAGVGVETIRFYERQGLIEQPRKPAGAGVRRYSAETIERIRFIKEAQQIGFSLREVQELLALRSDPSADCSDVRQQAIAKRAAVQRKIEQLRKIDAALGTLIASCPGSGGLQCCSIMDALSPRSREAAPRAPRAVAAVEHAPAKRRTGR